MNFQKKEESANTHNNSFKNCKKWSHLDFLIEKQKKLHIREPFDRFIFSIVKKGREDFEAKIRRLHSHPAYTNTLKEVQAELPSITCSTRQISKAVFSPMLLSNLIRELYGHKRWYRLYLIKILYKKPLLEGLKELMLCSEKLKQLLMDYKEDYNKFATAKGRGEERKEAQDKEKPPKAPFVCGSSAAMKQPKKPELTAQSIQELNHRQAQSLKLYHNQLLKVHFH